MPRKARGSRSAVCQWCGRVYTTRSWATGERESRWCGDACRLHAHRSRTSWDDTPTHAGCGGRLRRTRTKIAAVLIVRPPELVECDRCHTLYPAGDGAWSAPNPYPGLAAMRPAGRVLPTLRDAGATSQRPSPDVAPATWNDAGNLRASWQRSGEVFELLIRRDARGIGWEVYADDCDIASGELPTGTTERELRDEVQQNGVKLPAVLTWDRGLW